MDTETGVVTTAEEGTVVEPVSNTTPAPSVSTQPSPPAPAPKPSDAEVRIRNLQSQSDRFKAQADALTLEKATLLNQIETLKIEKESAIATAAEATRAAMAKAEELQRENATLKAQVARANFLIAHPDLMPFARLVPATEDAQQLETVANEIVAARNADLEAIQSRIRSGAAVPPASPARPSGQLTAAEIDRQLKEARMRGDEKEFNRLLEELAQRAVTQT